MAAVLSLLFSDTTRQIVPRVQQSYLQKLKTSSSKWRISFSMANELIYYGIHDGRFGRHMQMGSQDTLYGHIKARGIDDHVIAATRSFDPVEILPPELSLSCLLDSLQPGTSRGHYQSELLQMLNVSKKWCHYLISEPLLWNQIHIDCSNPDLLATLATFTRLSCTAPLDVVICGDLAASWNEIGAILLPHGQRIRSLTFKRSSHGGRDPELKAHVLSAIGILGSFPRLAGLEEIDFYVLMDLHSFDFDLPTIPRDVFVINPINISLLQVDLSMTSLRNYASIDTRRSLDDIMPLLCSLRVRDLRLYGGNIAQATASNIKLPLEVASQLKIISYHQPYCSTLDRLLRITAHQLSHLELPVGHSTTQEMIDTLSQFVNLKHLQLHSWRLATKMAPTALPLCGTAIHGLKRLQIVGMVEEGFDTLWIAFITMYPSVRHVEFHASRVSSICATYLASLAYIETLFFGSGTEFTSPQPVVHLPSLQSFSTWGHRTLQCFKLSNLLALILIVPRGGSTRFGTGSLPFLRRLTIQTSDLELNLEPSNYPELRRLILSHQKLRWQLSSLPKLISITLDSSFGDTYDGTLLCVELLYRPEYCPALQQIWFSKIVEWDMLFLMLEKRNQGTEGVSRINRISLPFIPFILRKPLALLLKGQSVERPPNLELSFEGARELLCDATIPGCFQCLRHMRPHCLELVKSGPVSPPLKLENVLVEYPDPPGDIPTEISDWVVQYQRLREEWKSLEIYRSKFCAAWYRYAI